MSVAEFDGKLMPYWGASRIGSTRGGAEPDRAPPYRRLPHANRRIGEAAREHDQGLEQEGGCEAATPGKRDAAPLEPLLDVEPLHERPSGRGDLFTARPALLEHQLHRIARHRPRLVKVLPLRLHLRQLRYVGVDPAVASVLEDDVELQRAHPEQATPAQSRGAGIPGRAG